MRGRKAGRNFSHTGSAHPWNREREKGRLHMILHLRRVEKGDCREAAKSLGLDLDLGHQRLCRSSPLLSYLFALPYYLTPE